MKVEIIGDLSALEEPLRAKARTLVIRDEFDQPVLVAQDLDSGKIFVSRAGSPDFEDALKSLGINVKVTYRNVRVSS